MHNAYIYGVSVCATGPTTKPKEKNWRKEKKESMRHPRLTTVVLYTRWARHITSFFVLFQVPNTHDSKET
jgi:hypothetical protein